MNKALQSEYFHWLVGQIEDGGEYEEALRVMHDVEFVWTVPNDDNRIVDGMDLRVEFLHDRSIFDIPAKDFGFCSVLEVMIGLSRRLAFAVGEDPAGWAWQLMDNLGLTKFKGPLSVNKGGKVHEIVHRVIWRTYEPDGTGGFFPLAWPREDQRKVELWYQMGAYIEEIHPEY
jgi:hypothetical protein